MIGIFVPIFLLTSGFSLTEVFVFYIIVNLAYAVAAVPAAHLDAKIGFKHVIMLSMPLPIIFFSVLNSIQTNGFPLWALALIFGIHSGLFWTSYHTDFATVSDGKHLDKEVGFVKFAIKISGVFGPVIGGFIIAVFGFTPLLWTVVILLALSLVPLFFSKDIHSKTKISLKKAFKGKRIRDWVALAASGFENNVASVIWPIFIFFSVASSFELVGFVTTVSLIFSLIFIIITGKLADKHRNAVMKFGAISNAVVWIGKLFATTVPFVFVTDSLHGATNTMMTVPFEAKTYNNAAKQGVLEYVLFRATAVGVGGALIFVIMLFVTELTHAFWMGAASSLLFILL
jgi:MFS family permease